MAAATCGLKSHSKTCSEPASVYGFPHVCLAPDQKLHKKNKRLESSSPLIAENTKHTHRNKCPARPSLRRWYLSREDGKSFTNYEKAVGYEIDSGLGFM